MLCDEEIIVSVALIVYNHEKYLRQAIESILMQEVDFKYEIIVGDDCSTDQSREIILKYKKKFPEKFILKFQEQNVGGTKNCYDVYMQARGKYIAILEGDDYWIDSKKLQKTVDFLESNRDYLGVGHLIEARDLNGNFIATYPNSPKIIGKDVTMDLFLKGNYFSAVATVFRNIFLDSSQEYTFIYKINKYVGDLTFCVMLLDKGKIKVLNQAMSVYRSRSVEGESNYNSIRNQIQKYNDHIEIINFLRIHYKNNKYNFNKEYLVRTSGALVYSIKENKLKEFNTIFNKIPFRVRLYFLGYFPIFIVNWLISKFSNFYVKLKKIRVTKPL